MVLTIRPAVAADQGRCLELVNSLAEHAGASVHERAAEVFEQLLDGARGLVLVAQEEEVVLGLASVSFNLAMRYGGEYCQLEELIVDPAARGKNVGAALVEATLALARERGCGEYGLYLVERTESNWPFYQKFGFERVGTELRQPL